jgi:hypothetical protein
MNSNPATLTATQRAWLAVIATAVSLLAIIALGTAA